jgi:hypothetical protein
MASGRPYNVTIGRDVNGNSLYNDRPAYATDLSRASLVRTALGIFDTSPLPGQAIIPRNLGEAPGLVTANLRLAKTFSFGEKQAQGKKSSSDPYSSPLPSMRGTSSTTQAWAHRVGT